MEKLTAAFKNAWPYQEDKMKLPVPDLDPAISFYENTMGFQLVSRSEAPFKSAILSRDIIQIGIEENGGDSSQDGCFFEVDNVMVAWEELKSNGLDKAPPDFTIQTHGNTRWKVFFVVAPDGLCFCIGERQ
jgi:lactoylglutathione lyase